MSQDTSIYAEPSTRSGPPHSVVGINGNTFLNANRDVFRTEHNENHWHFYNTGSPEGIPIGNRKKDKAKPKATSGSRRSHWPKIQALISFYKILKYVKFKRWFNSNRKAIICDLSSMDFTFLSSHMLENYGRNDTRRTTAVTSKKSLPEIYLRSISTCSHEFGCPLYQPDSELSTELQRGCIKIGDVGVITRDGRFDPLFNVCPSHNRCRNPSRLPNDFEEIGPLEISDYQYNPFKLLSVGVSQTGVSPNSYRCTANGGAILELPVGAHRIEARNTGIFRNLADRQALNWYRYLLIDRAIDAQNGSLLIVSGYIKSRNWGIAVFDRPSTSDDYLHFIADQALAGHRGPTYRYRWSSSGPALGKVGADSHEVMTAQKEPSQCIFLRGYQIALPDEEWKVLKRYSGVRR